MWTCTSFSPFPAHYRCALDSVVLLLLLLLLLLCLNGSMRFFCPGGWGWLYTSGSGGVLSAIYRWLSYRLSSPLPYCKLGYCTEYVRVGACFSGFFWGGGGWFFYLPEYVRSIVQQEREGTLPRRDLLEVVTVWILTLCVCV
ncbi:uncharacterized protein BO95DRAFT_63802 [Aspergillus brunneoviolaceus CBS 621.78]|uniref:Uncharacterized protein n=1 Tax=Aspergillus brunneoviolaceus CBS 621.78 TaxID=1450534 RepID=A0ACD1GFJ7_9EURO|nr:hypothetical protein BO95DRAFT_63802 [Aspergillus brunneoviolaceus CBS 621.78]RAH48002.1 hypothetical protein BO95DRAFT_63802 [Aspergillus brunneoviolaceus CBS 621.78]